MPAVSLKDIVGEAQGFADRRQYAAPRLRYHAREGDPQADLNATRCWVPSLQAAGRLPR